MGWRWSIGRLVAGALFVLLVGALVVPPRAVSATSEVPESCTTGYALLSAGQLDAASDAFNTDKDHPECARGLLLTDRQREEADDQKQACQAAADTAAQADATKWSEAQQEALATCADAVRLDRSLSDDVNEALAEIPDEPTSETGRTTAEGWWSGVWSNSQDTATRIGQALLLVALALPLLNAVGTAIGRRGAPWIRRSLRRQQGSRAAIGVLLAAGLVIRLSDTSIPLWIDIIPPAIAVLLVGFALLPSEEFAWELAVGAALAAIVASLIYSQSDWTFADPYLTVAVPTMIFVALGWVLAQRQRVRFDRFSSADGAVDPGSPIGQLIATELARLVEDKGGSIEVVDPFAHAQLDSDSISALSGPEDKVVAAAVKLFQALLQTGSDLQISGQLIAAGRRGEGISIQLRHGRTLVSAAAIYSRELGRSLAGDQESVKSDKESEKSTTSHTDLARPAATWVLLELLREFEGDELQQVEGLGGATNWRTLAYQAAAIDHLNGGETAGALECYARAWHADPGNRAARLGFMMLSARTATSDEFERASEHLIETAHQLATEVADDSAGILSLHAKVVATLNLCASRAKSDGRNRDEDDALLVAIRADVALLRSRLAADESKRKPALNESSHSQMQVSLDSMGPFAAAWDPTTEQEWILESSKSIRGSYNAASYLATPLVRTRRTTDAAEALKLLRVAVAHPTFAAYAKNDPFFAALKSNPEFVRLVDPPKTPTNLGSLARVTVIGKHYSDRLAAHDVTTLAALSRRTDAEIIEWTEAPNELLAAWRDLAALDAMAGIGERYANLLYLCGVPSVEALAGCDAVALRRKLDSVGLASGVTRTPSDAEVRSWIAQAEAVLEAAED
ncbi:MAG: DUF4332 domain-containing protein [Ilumatobacteraceae bacterium]|nr:DUF4332 domain-containing protein [Ilumatobacteraceae bacterium]